MIVEAFEAIKTLLSKHQKKQISLEEALQGECEANFHCDFANDLFYSVDDKGCKKCSVITANNGQKPQNHLKRCVCFMDGQAMKQFLIEKNIRKINISGTIYKIPDKKLTESQQKEASML